jgi:hypothetical protein
MQNEPNIDKRLDDLDAGRRECLCDRPLRVERAERHGAARTYCARCGLPAPIRLVRP